MSAAIEMKEGDDPNRALRDYDVSSSSSSGDEDFQDAVEQFDGVEEQPRYPMDLTTSLEHCEVALNRFLNNDLQGAMAIMRPWSQTSLYHSLATSIFEFIPAVLTLDPQQVATALRAIKRTVALCQQYRRSYSLVESIGTMIRKTNFSTFTELEAHAELCYAETLLLQAALSLFESEDLAALVRATLKVKASHSSYKNCERILQQRCWADGRSRRDFESGVRLGVATFNVVISMLPARLMMILSYAGFNGDRAAGLADLERGSLAGGLRAPLCDLTLLAVQLVVVHFVAGNPDMDRVESILRARLQQYPESAFFLLFRARSQLLVGDTSGALSNYTQVASISNLWPQMRQLTYWDSMWACSIDLRWREAARFAELLLRESTWSCTFFAYARAAFLLELNDLSPDERTEIDQLIQRAPGYQQRIAGKSLPIEKFIIRRCNRWANSEKLVLPGLELLCLWNMFPPLAAKATRVQAALKMIATETARVEGAGSRLQADNEAVVNYLHGCLLLVSRRIPNAITQLTRVVELQDQIREDTFIVPYAMYEIACCHMLAGDKVRGRRILRDIRRRYSGYLLESRLLFRIHSRLDMNPAQGAEEAADYETMKPQID